MNKEEFYLQKQIWLEYQVELLTAYKDQMKLHRQCMEQLIYYGLEYDPQTLVPILQVAFQVNNKGFKNSLFGKTFLNKLIWNILYNSMRSIHPPYSNPSENNITKAQECVVTQLSKQFPRSTKPHMNLELKGYMGIVLAIQKMSTVKAKKLLEIAEQQYNPDHSDNLNFSDINSYHFTKIALAESPDQLLYSFNVAADNISHVAMIWFAFISKLDEFGLLNDGRSVKILDQLLAKGSNILITKDIMLRLLKPITNLHAMEKFLTMIESSNSNLLKYHASSILPKYLRLVYNKTSQKNSQSFKRPKYVPSIVCKGNDISKNLPFIEYCRLVYSLIDRKTANIVGIHLFGESDLQPENIYSLYQEELLNFQVTEECLAALIRASMNNTVSGDCIQWGEMYAPQVAIHEFSKHVMKNKEENAKLYPSDTLWRRYIGMLSKYQYISQLSQIIEWWEAIDFIPSAECLMDLLVALPEGFGERHVKHYEKVVANEPIKRLHSRTVIAPISSISDWNWPTESELIHVRNLKKNQ